MTKQRLHSIIHRIYKVILGTLALLTIYFTPDTKMAILIFTMLWIFEDEIEDVITGILHKIIGSKQHD